MSGKRRRSISGSSYGHDSDSGSSSDDEFYKRNNEQGPYGFEWATSWVEDLPSGYYVK